MRLVYTPETYIISVCLLFRNKQDVRQLIYWNQTGGDSKQTLKFSRNSVRFGEKKLKNTERNHTCSCQIYFSYLHIYFECTCNYTQDLSKISDITDDIILTDSHLLLEIQKLVPPKVKAPLYHAGVFSILRQDLALCPLKETTFLLFLQNVSIYVLIMELLMHL